MIVIQLMIRIIKKKENVVAQESIFNFKDESANTGSRSNCQIFPNKIKYTGKIYGKSYMLIQWVTSQVLPVLLILCNGSNVLTLMDDFIRVLIASFFFVNNRNK